MSGDEVAPIFVAVGDGPPAGTDGAGHGPEANGERGNTMLQTSVKGPLEGSPICGRCGLKAVRHELERQGITMHFCEDCYWGVAEEEPSPSGEEVAEESPAGKRKIA